MPVLQITNLSIGVQAHQRIVLETAPTTGLGVIGAMSCALRGERLGSVPMKIYTRTGDAGDTGLFGGARVGKDDPRVEAYGTVDELNSCIGAARALGVSAQTDPRLLQIQSDLFTLGAELACAPGKEQKLRVTPVAEADIARLEAWIDQSETALEPLQNFVLPGGCPSAAELHRARTVCRRAERRTLTAGRSTPIRPGVLIYLNRLSDLLFVLARFENHVAGVLDLPWHAG